MFAAASRQVSSFLLPLPRRRRCDEPTRKHIALDISSPVTLLKCCPGGQSTREGNTLRSLQLQMWARALLCTSLQVGSGGFRKVSQSQPAVPYEAVDQDAAANAQQSTCKVHETSFDMNTNFHANSQGGSDRPPLGRVLQRHRFSNSFPEAHAHCPAHCFAPSFVRLKARFFAVSVLSLKGSTVGFIALGRPSWS